MTKEVAANYVSGNLWGKNIFVNLNGLFVRICGKRLHNNVVLLKNNMLAHAYLPEYNMQKPIKNISKLSSFLSNKNIPFVYVLAPYKVPIKGKNLPANYKNFANNREDKLVFGLMQNNVHVIDLRNYLSANINQVNKYFYRTDHHWNPEGAFLAFQKLTEKFREWYPSKQLSSKSENKNLWNRFELPDWFLGSHGKRVGTLFAGTDTLIYYTPKFKTQMSCIVPHHKKIYSGDFYKANIRAEYLIQKDYFGKNPYCVYIGGDYPLVLHRNAFAPKKIKLLIIKDSFTLPLQSFLSTMFSEIDVIDPRHYHSSSIIEYILWTKPDMVIMMQASSTLADSRYYEFGIEKIQYSQNMVYPLLKKYNVKIAANKNNFNCRRLPISIERGKIYTVSCENIEVTNGKTDGVSMLLYDRKKRKIVLHQILDTNYYKYEKLKQWTFKVPNKPSDYALLVYAGIHGGTNDIGVNYININVYKTEPASN